MKRTLIACLLALALLPALLLPCAGAAGLTTDFKTLRINSVAEPPHTLGDSGSDVTVVVVGRVICGLTLNRVQIAQSLTDSLHISNGRVYLLDMDQDRETVEGYASYHPETHVAWQGWDRTYQNLFWEIHRACFPGSSGSATLPALCVLDGDCNPIYYASGSAIDQDKLAQVLAPYGKTEPVPDPDPIPDPEPTPDPAPPALFQDVEQSDYFYDAVRWAVEENITTGSGNGRFDPAGACSRGQMVTFLWRASGSPAPEKAASFTDVAGDAYYRDAVAWAVERGITTGTGNGQFSPDTPVTRAQVVTFLHRSAGTPAATEGSFTDVPAGAYYAKAVGWAMAQGITNGLANNRFAPELDCTRAQVVTFLYRGFGV